MKYRDNFEEMKEKWKKEKEKSESLGRNNELRYYEEKDKSASLGGKRIMENE
jgi:hypothetical protein